MEMLADSDIMEILWNSISLMLMSQEYSKLGFLLMLTTWDYSRGADIEHSKIAGSCSGGVFKQPLVYCALFCSCARIALPDETLRTETLQKEKIAEPNKN